MGIGINPIKKVYNRIKGMNNNPVEQVMQERLDKAIKVAGINPDEIVGASTSVEFSDQMLKNAAFFRTVGSSVASWDPVIKGILPAVGVGAGALALNMYGDSLMNNNR